MTRSTRGSLVAVAVAACFLSACGGDESAPRAPFEVTAADLSLDDLPEAVSGELAGEAFLATDVRIRVESHVGRHRVDLFFSDTDFDECALPLPRHGRRAFIRLPGLTELEPGELSGTAGDDGTASVHYEVPADSGYQGVGGGAFRLQVESVEQDVVAGRVHVCFDDGRGSCLSGRFRAQPCRGPIDGVAVRETQLLGEARALALDAPSEPPAGTPGQED